MENQEQQNKDKMNGLLKSQKGGITSMRRVLALLFALTFIALMIFGLVFDTEWKILLVTGGLSLGGSITMMFFTTWEDISKVVGFHK